jgi:DNA-binding CsgD family transcriptional regulator
VSTSLNDSRPPPGGGKPHESDGADDTTRTSHPTASSETRVAAVVAEGDIFDAALLALVESAGHPAILVEPAQLTALRNPGALLVRSGAMLGFVRRVPSLRTVRVIFLGDGVAGHEHIRISPRAPNAEAALERALSSTVGPPAPSTPAIPVNRVRVTDREREILQTYTLGATLRQTSREHQIAESTVREHYRRVARRYEEAGRPIGNKAQLLLEFMADGWVRP